MRNRFWTQLKKGVGPKGLNWLNTHHIKINTDYQELLKSIDIDTVQGILDNKRGVVVSTDRKQEKNTVKRIEITFKGKKRILYLKLYRNYRFKMFWGKALRGFLIGRSIARAEYESLEKLAQWGLRTPQLVAWGDHRFAGGVIHSFIITEEIPEAMGLDFLFHEWFSQQAKNIREQKKTDLINEVAGAIRQMHDFGFEHHDLFLRNIMISEQDMSKLYILDAPRAHIWPQFIMHMRRAIDLATLDSAVTRDLRRSQRMRFMHLYLKHDKLTDKDKVLVRKILKLAKPMRKKQLLRLERSIKMDILYSS